MSYAAVPHTHLPLLYPPQLPNQVQLPQPSLPVVVPASTEPSRLNGAAHSAADSSVVDSAQLSVSTPSLLFQPPAQVAGTNISAQCPSIDDIMSLLADIGDPSCTDAGQIDLGLNGPLSDFLSDSAADFDTAAAASDAASHPQTEMTITEPQDTVNINYSNLMNQLQQLNNLTNQCRTDLQWEHF